MVDREVNKEMEDRAMAKTLAQAVADFMVALEQADVVEEQVDEALAHIRAWNEERLCEKATDEEYPPVPGFEWVADALDGLTIRK